MSKFRVFVYGTLKTAEPNHYLMSKETVGLCVFKGNAVTMQKYPLVVASRYNVPYMLGAEGKGHNIQGEVYEVDDDQLARLDQLEQHPKLYERREIQVKMLSGEEGNSTISIMAYILVKYQPHLLELPMVESYTDGQVQGEVYEVDDDDLAMLDELEMYPKLYERYETTVELTNKTGDGNDSVSALCYFLVQYRPSLLELTLFESYSRNIEGYDLRLPENMNSEEVEIQTKQMDWSEVHTEFHN